MEAGLIFQQQDGVAGVFVFRHALIQEAAYTSMPERTPEATYRSLRSSAPSFPSCGQLTRNCSSPLYRSPSIDGQRRSQLKAAKQLQIISIHRGWGPLSGWAPIAFSKNRGSRSVRTSASAIISQCLYSKVERRKLPGIRESIARLVIMIGDIPQVCLGFEWAS
jgi:hypothetical protein